MNSFHFGKASIRASEFAKSDSDLKTAEVVASDAHTLESKKFRVKLHLGIWAKPCFLDFLVSSRKSSIV